VSRPLRYADCSGLYGQRRTWCDADRWSCCRWHQSCTHYTIRRRSAAVVLLYISSEDTDTRLHCVTRRLDALVKVETAYQTAMTPLRPAMHLRRYIGPRAVSSVLERLNTTAKSNEIECSQELSNLKRWDRVSKSDTRMPFRTSSFSRFYSWRHANKQYGRQMLSGLIPIDRYWRSGWESNEH